MACTDLCFKFIVSVCVIQVSGFCKMMSDFAMEYRTTYDKVQAKLERIKHEKERNKKRGKLIVSCCRRCGFSGAPSL